jgi:stage III sporulation protein AB
MLKIFAALIVVVCFGMVGLMIARQYTERPIQLRNFQFCLQMLATDINYAAYPLPEALFLLSKKADQKLAEMFKLAGEMLLNNEEGHTAGEVWELALKQIAPKTALKAADQDILINLGRSLGLSDREDQLKHIQLAITQLDQQVISAQSERDKNEQIWKYLGFCTGLIVVIFII